MRFFILVVPALFLMVYTSYRNDNDVIAEMKFRSITRAEFHQWLSGRDIDPEEIYNNNGQSEMLLQQMAVEILSVEKAVSDNFDTTPFYDNINRMVFANLLSTYYKSEIKNNLNYNEPAVEVKLLKLYFPQDHNNRQDQDIYSDKIALAGHIIQQYKSGISFDDLNRKYSEDKYSYNAGKSNVIPELLLEKELADKIKNLKDGDSISEPAVFNDHVLIVNIIRRMFITKNNAERLINNNDLYDQFMEKMSEGIIEYIIAENGVHLNIVSNIEKASFKQNNELLFSVDGESFTSGQLKELLNLFNFLKFKKPGSAFEQNFKKNMALNIFNEQILSHVAQRKGVHDEKGFRERWESVRKSTLAGAYKYYAIMVNPEYDKLHAENIYNLSGESKSGNKKMNNNVLMDLPDRLSKHGNKSIESIKLNWERRLLDSASFIINRDVLD